MLNYESCKRNSEVITKTLLTNFERKGLAVVAVLRSLNTILIVVDLRERVSGIQNSEKKLVSLFAVLAEKSAEVLH